MYYGSYYFLMIFLWGYHHFSSVAVQSNCYIQVELTHKKCAAGERRISELEAQLALANEESASLKDHIKSLEGKVLEDKRLKHQVELSEHRFTQAQQRIKVKILIIHYLSICLSGLVTAVTIFRNPNTIPFCLTSDLLLNVLFSWLLVHLPSTFFLDVLFL